MSRLRGVAAVLVLSLLAGACSAVAEGSEEPGPLVVVLFDVSGSTDSDEIRAGYLEAFGRVLDFADERDGTVIADVVDENPLAHSTYPVNATFEACNALTDNQLTCDTGAQQTRDEAETTVEQILESEERPAGTDIHNGLRLAERVFDCAPPSSPRPIAWGHGIRSTRRSAAASHPSASAERWRARECPLVPDSRLPLRISVHPVETSGDGGVAPAVDHSRFMQTPSDEQVPPLLSLADELHDGVLE